MQADVLQKIVIELYIDEHHKCNFFNLFAIYIYIVIFEHVRKKTNNLGLRPGLTQTGLYSHRRWLEAGNFGFRK